MSAELTPVNPAEPGFEIRTYFIRHRNVLLAKADFGEMYVDYYLHLGENKLKPLPEHDAMFKRALAAYALHCASRPWKEMSAWTLNFQQPLVNLFLTADNETGAITGRIFADHVREAEANIFYSDLVRPQEPRRRSTVNFTGSDPLVAVEALYAQSEQRPARLFQLAEEEFAFVADHPDCDTEWFNALTADAVKKIDETETLSLLERRVYRWHCGCNELRMMQVLTAPMQQDPDGLFGDQPQIEIRCPRCAARYTLTRAAMEAFVKG